MYVHVYVHVCVHVVCLTLCVAFGSFKRARNLHLFDR